MTKGISWTRFHNILKISLCYEFAWFSVRQTLKSDNSRHITSLANIIWKWFNIVNVLLLFYAQIYFLTFWWYICDLICHEHHWLHWKFVYGMNMYKCLSPLKFWVWIPLRRYNIIWWSSQWLATGRCFSPGTPISFTFKTDGHDITDILLKVEL